MRSCISSSAVTENEPLNRFDCAGAPPVTDGCSLENRGLPSAHVASYTLPPTVTVSPVPPASRAAANFSRVRL